MRCNFFLVSFVLLVPATLTLTSITVFEVTAKTLEVINSLAEVSAGRNEHVDSISTPSSLSTMEFFTVLDKINLDIITLSQKINGVDKQLNNIMKIFKKNPKTMWNEQTWNYLRQLLHCIDEYFRYLKKYIRDGEEYEKRTVLEFANNVLGSRPNSVNNILKIIFYHILEQDFLKNLYNLYHSEKETYSCQEQSLQQVLLSFISRILVTNLKGYTFMKTSYLLRKKFKLGNFTKEMKDLDKDLKKRNDEFITAVKPFTANASQEVWKCDPNKHKKEKTYTEITNFVHGFVLNKANLDPKQSCSEECSTYNFVKKTECNVEKKEAKLWCQKQKNCSTIINCNYVDSEMDICRSKMTKNNRRYEYINFGNGRKYGKINNKSCKKYHLQTYNEWLIRKCSYCFCLCFEEENVASNRYINLQLARSNISDNKVVTGVRFTKHNDIIHLQVQEGKLLPQGKIDLDSVRWVPPNDYYRNDKRISDGQDYHTLTWKQREFDLTDIMINSDGVVTGVRLKKVGGRLHLEVFGTMFNFTTGELMKEKNYFEDDPLLSFKHRFGKELILYKPDIPTLVQSYSYSDFTTNKFVKFRETDFDKDAGQTTVPFFDTQPVTSKVVVPLSGVGIFHKGAKGSGGFLAPKIFTYNYTVHIQQMLLDDKL